MKGLSFDLFGFDYLPQDSIYGVWAASVKDFNCEIRNLLCIHYSDGEWRVDLLWIHVV